MRIDYVLLNITIFILFYTELVSKNALKSKLNDLYVIKMKFEHYQLIY